MRRDLNEEYFIINKDGINCLSSLFARADFVEKRVAPCGGYSVYYIRVNSTERILPLQERIDIHSLGGYTTIVEISNWMFADKYSDLYFNIYGNHIDNTRVNEVSEDISATGVYSFLEALEIITGAKQYSGLISEVCTWFFRAGMLYTDESEFFLESIYEMRLNGDSYFNNLLKKKK